MKALWERIEAWLSESAPLVFESLRSGVSEQDLVTVESAVRHPLVPDYRESLTLHDGQELDQYGCSPGFIYGLNLYPASKSVARWQGMTELWEQGVGHNLPISTHGAVRPVWWDKQWIPIADDGNNNYCCLDFHPQAKGHVGQVIQVWNESQLRTVLSPSFHEWLTVFAELLEAGEYIYSEAHNGLISLEDAIADGVVQP